MLRDHWFLILGIAAIAVPGIMLLARITWTTEQGAQGPIILATGLWLFAREYGPLKHLARPGRTKLVVPAFALFTVGFLIGRIIGAVSIEWLFVSLLLLTVFYAYNGGRVTKGLWFPILYLFFLVPPPYSVTVALTGSLQLLITKAAVAVTSFFGLPVAFSGTALFIGPYELLVAAACSGMNSLFSLLAIGLFYIFLRHRADWRYAALLAALVIPIAILTNLIRVLILVMITHWFGDAAAQGLLHEAAGMMMFFVALFALMGVDAVLSPFRDRLFRKRPA
ncbi:exosortase V [Sphingomonas sp. 1P06PA]|uniref:exosortase V n=1 Tax=Sphingomonas sp. 1P06PA TaxID=554121 RepID=UPI0039A47F3E